MASSIDPNEQTGKDRVRRIPLDYHRQVGTLQRWRTRATWSAVLATLAYIAWVGFTTRGTQQLSTGPLSRAHASLDSNCAACHTSFTPIAADAFRIRPAAAMSTTSANCLTCHSSIGRHSEFLNAEGQLIDQNCAACHQEHLGLANSLIPTDDRTCIECHQNLAAFRQPPAPGTRESLRNVSSFTPDGHGEFRSLAALRGGVTASDQPKSDSGIRFDHAQHMMPGQVIAGRRGGLSLERIEPRFRDQYREAGQDDQSLIQLQCADCHDYRVGDTATGRLGDQWGPVSQPIRFEQHCVACHPLSAPGQREGQFGIPHGVPLSALRDDLAARASAANADRAAMQTQTEQAEPLPLRVPGADEAAVQTPAAPIDPTAPEGTADATRAATLMQRVRDQCRVCHGQADLEQSFQLSRLPKPRLTHGSFDHAAHRGAACVLCHPQADPSGQTLSAQAMGSWGQWLTRFDSPAIIQGIDSCTPCHQPVATRPRPSKADESNFGVLFGGLSDQAPSHCGTCHSYHSHGNRSADAARSTDALSAWPHSAWTPPDREPPDEVLPPDAALTLVRSPASRSSAMYSAGLRHGGTDAGTGTFVRKVPDADGGADADATRRGNDRETLTAEQTQPGVADDETVPRSAWLGNASCAASTCHGGAIREEPHWNSSKTLFEAHDPHGLAGETLKSEASRAVLLGLDPDAASSPARFRELMRARCDSCHSPADAANPSLADASPTSVSEGVGCEACHGPAGDWLAPHLERDWQVREPMREQRQYVARVEGCVRCHVGSRREDGMVRDMNHDLIAAGHPALRFDAWSALRRLPSHGGGDRTRDGLPLIDGEAELRRLLTGRVVALRAALRLASERFEDAQQPHPGDAIWPEFSDYDCFGCHQRLTPAKLVSRPSDGFPLPHAWLQAGLITELLQDRPPEELQRWEQAMQTLRLRLPAAGEIDSATQTADQILTELLARLGDPAPLPAELIAGRRLPVADDSSAGVDQKSPQFGNWNDAAQWYLSSQARLRDRRQVADPDAVAALLLSMANELKFRGSVAAADSVWDSPEAFDPVAFSKLADELNVAAERE